MENILVTKAKPGLEAFRIAGLPPDFYYIPNFISVEEEASILQKVSNNPSLLPEMCQTCTFIVRS
jgi:hypothetical protein